MLPPFSPPSGPRAVQDGSGAAMGLHSHSCLLFIVFLPFLLRFWRTMDLNTSIVCVWACVCACACDFYFYFSTGTINWCTVSAWSILLRYDVDTLNKYVTNFFLFFYFKDVTNVLHFNWGMLDISCLNYIILDYLFFFCTCLGEKNLNVVSLIPINLSSFLTTLHIHLNSRKKQVWEVNVKYLKVKWWKWSRRNLGYPEAESLVLSYFNV